VCLYFSDVTTPKVSAPSGDYKDGMVDLIDAAAVSKLGETMRQLVTDVRVRVFSRMFSLEDAIEFHPFAPLEALPCV
jgi:hypothetical protein